MTNMRVAEARQLVKKRPRPLLSFHALPRIDAPSWPPFSTSMADSLLFSRARACVRALSWSAKASFYARRWRYNLRRVSSYF